MNNLRELIYIMLPPVLPLYALILLTQPTDSTFRKYLFTSKLPVSVFIGTYLR